LREAKPIHKLFSFLICLNDALGFDVTYFPSFVAQNVNKLVGHTSIISNIAKTVCCVSGNNGNQDNQRQLFQTVPRLCVVFQVTMEIKTTNVMAVVAACLVCAQAMSLSSQSDEVRCEYNSLHHSQMTFIVT